MRTFLLANSNFLIYSQGRGLLNYFSQAEFKGKHDFEKVYLFWQILKVNMQNMYFKILIIFLCVVHLSIYCQGRPLR